MSVYMTIILGRAAIDEMFLINFRAYKSFDGRLFIAFYLGWSVHLFVFLCAILDY